ncbi:MAG: PTS sugar transporter subunit IIB [Candidatus Methylomirabilis sp.]|nr:PTS sugar transporter subunit IIB [Deltaproteobacteria bacterium]
MSFVRVDNRLLHGQVLEAWVPFAKATLVVVASDSVVQDSLTCMAMECAMPAGVELEIHSVEEAARLQKSGEWESERAVILFKTPEDVLRAMDAGFRTPNLNLGNMHFEPGKVEVTQTIFWAQSDRKALEEIARRGVHVEIQTIPSDRVVDVDGLLLGGPKR